MVSGIAISEYRLYFRGSKVKMFLYFSYKPGKIEKRKNGNFYTKPDKI